MECSRMGGNGTEGKNPAGGHGPDMFCDFSGKKYSPGESWHPYLEPQGLMYCIRCSCSENGNTRCYRIQCPALQCASPVTDPQQCCPRCLEPNSPSGLRAPAKSCQYNGTTYQQGEMFTTSELFPSRQPNQCVQCSCSEGQIYCGLVTCPELLCSSPLTVPDSCCQVCKDGSYEKSAEEEPLQLNRGVRHSQDQCSGEAMGRKPLGATASTVLSSSLEFIPRSFKPKGGGGTTVKIVLKEKHKKACVYNGKTYSHGEVWHPVFRLYGLLPCILCTCRDGVQDCQKISCPKEYPCDYPEKVDGKCCKICPETRVKPTDEIVTAQCGKNPNRVLVYMFVPPSSETSKEVLRTIAIEKEPSEEVEIYNWKLIKEGSVTIGKEHELSHIWIPPLHGPSLYQQSSVCGEKSLQGTPGARPSAFVRAHQTYVASSVPLLGRCLHGAGLSRRSWQQCPAQSFARLARVMVGVPRIFRGRGF
ncbi:chordin-like protein 2 isoform X2 [Oxyura jamaicensis]|uniref:chordin-like protein 2 isoform X2 n=1 Tax=Oxyura jamaicensis TaxID=8884 RepID=UPI0015A6E79C|nr:chordin-like protein 2 isoform X2 [Oxyura jamaicensis]